MTGVENISNIIENYISEKKLKGKLNSCKIFNYWEEIVGKEIAKNCKPEKLKNKVLYISTVNPIWANELNLMSQNIIIKINDYLKDDTVSALRTRSNLQ